MTVLNGVHDLEARLNGPFDVVAITRTKFVRDQVQARRLPATRPKAQLVSELGALVFTDDQGGLVFDVRAWQKDLPQGGRTHLVKAGSIPSESLIPVERLLRTFPRAPDLRGGSEPVEKTGRRSRQVSS